MTDREPQNTPDLSQCELFEERLAELLCTDPLDLEGFLQSDEHLRQCGTCREVMESLASATQIPACPTPVVTAALAQVAASRRRVRRIGLAAAMSAAAMALVSAMVFFSSPRTTSLNETAPLVLRSSPLGEDGGETLVAGQNTKAVRDSLFATADKALEVGFQAGSSMQIPQLDGEGVALVLRSGLLAIALDPDRHLPLTVTLGSARIRVTGTVLFADATLGQAGVLEGVIEVRVKDAPPIQVQAGHILDLPTSRLSSLDEDTANRVRQLLGKTTATNPLSMDINRDTGPDKEEMDDSEPVIDTDSKTAELKASHLSSRQEPVRHGAKSPNDSFAKTSKRQAQPLKVNLLAEARRCRASRDWVCAAQNYELAVSSLPGSNEAMVALVSLAELELEHLGRPAAALAHYSEYLSRSPRGALAPEAMHGRCRALGILGRPTEEKACLEKFVKTYPDSPYARRAQVRLDN